MQQRATGNDLCLKWKRVAGNHFPPAAGNNRRGSVTLLGSRVYCGFAGGYLSVFSLLDYRWQSLGKPLLRVDGGHAAQLAGDKIYFLYKDVVEYDTVTEEVTTVATVQGADTWMAAAFAPWRDEIITFGGFSFQFTNEMHAFHVESKTWKKLELNGKPPERRNAAAAVICGKKMFVYGGYSISGYPLGDLWIADLSNSRAPSWSLAKTSGRFSTGPGRPSLCNIDDLLVVFGEFRTPNAKVLVYSLLDREWYSQLDKQAVVLNDPPPSSYAHKALAVNAGILYFTERGVYLLSRE